MHTTQSDAEKPWVNNVCSQNTDVKCVMLIKKIPVKFQIDTGATANLLPHKYLPSNARTEPTDIKLRMWNKTEISALCTAEIVLKNPKNKKKHNVRFIVVKENLTPLLGWKTCEELKLININSENIKRVNKIDEQSIIDKHKTVFNDELGCISGEHK